MIVYLVMGMIQSRRNIRMRGRQGKLLERCPWAGKRGCNLVHKLKKIPLYPVTPKLLEILNCLSRFSLTSCPHFSYILETLSPLPWKVQLTWTFAYVFSTGNVLASLWHIWFLPSKILLSATFLSKASLITPRRGSSSSYLPDFFFNTLNCCPISLSRQKAPWGEDSHLLLQHHCHCHCHYWEQHYAKCFVSFNKIAVQFYKGANKGLE